MPKGPRCRRSLRGLALSHRARSIDVGYLRSAEPGHISAERMRGIPPRLDAFFDYQEWLGEWEKPLWAVLQAFSGEGYWSRDPTPEETWAMMILSFNHGAKGIMSWTFPASGALQVAHGQMAKVATVAPVSTFLLGAQPVREALEELWFRNTDSNCIADADNL